MMKDVYVKFVNGMDVRYSNVKTVLMAGDDWDVELKFNDSRKIHLNKSQILFIETIDAQTSLGKKARQSVDNEEKIEDYMVIEKERALYDHISITGTIQIVGEIRNEQSRRKL